MKRTRENLAEEEPLSKRINNLHIDGYVTPFSATSPSFPTSYSSMSSLPSMSEGQDNLLPHISVTDSAKASHSQPLVSFSGKSNYSDPSAISSIDTYSNMDTESLNHYGINGHISEKCVISDFENHSIDIKHMIENRELPDSLSINYPTKNPTTNENYFLFNRLLHNLHLERLKRQGKLT